jgi:chromate transporter
VPELSRLSPPDTAAAFRFWLKLGFISFGGPAGQIAIMHQELVEKRRWISEARFLHALNYCMLLPGPEAQQLATYVGWLLHRTRGGLVAGLLFILPSLVILLALSYLYVAYGQLPAVAAFFFGIKPAVVAIVAFAAWRIGGRVIRNVVLAGIAVAAFVALAVFGVPFPLVVLGAALLGWLGAKLSPASFDVESHAVAASPESAAVIDDHSATPGHATFSWRRTLWVLGAGLVLWLAAMALLIHLQGSSGTLPLMGAFFSKAALVTFGGAYAVLPYVNQGAVEQHHWLTASQMIDGLALGETTPGPLIMVVTFVGFVGGWTHAATQGLTPGIAGLLGGLVVTFFTFLPSFIFIFAGAPLVEATRGLRHLTAPLTAVTAAVVGVILNLAVFFATHVCFPAGVMQKPDWISLAIAAAAALALFRFRVGVIPVILAAGIAGVILRLALTTAA